jgi:nucleotide-binding universal stress UspA family protein
MAAATPPRGYGLVACCVEGPEGGPALDEAARVAALGGGRLSLVHVAESAGRFTGGRTAWSPPEESVAAGIAAEARAWLERLAEEAGAGEAVVLQGSDPAEAILRWAVEARCELLVVHPRRGGVVHRVLGSVTARLAREAPCPVMVVPPSGR